MKSRSHFLVSHKSSSGCALSQDHFSARCKMLQHPAATLSCMCRELKSPALKAAEILATLTGFESARLFRDCSQLCVDVRVPARSIFTSCAGKRTIPKTICHAVSCRFTFCEPVIFSAMLSQQFKAALDELARNGVFVGTSSWKYPGWCGQLYDDQRYLTQKKILGGEV